MVNLIMQIELHLHSAFLLEWSKNIIHPLTHTHTLVVVELPGIRGGSSCRLEKGSLNVLLSLYTW